MQPVHSGMLQARVFRTELGAPAAAPGGQGPSLVPRAPAGAPPTAARMPVFSSAERCSEVAAPLLKR